MSASDSTSLAADAEVQAPKPQAGYSDTVGGALEYEVVLMSIAAVLNLVLEPRLIV